MSHSSPPRIRRGYRFALAACIFFAGTVVIAQVAGGDADYVAQTVTNPRPTLGGPRSFETGVASVAMGARAVSYHTTDFAFANGIHTIGFTRYFTNTQRTWDVTKQFIDDPDGYPDAPFGHGPAPSNLASSILWWHNYYSFIVGKTNDPTLEVVHMPGGESKTFAEPGTGAFSSTRQVDDSKLYEDTSGNYVLFVPGDGRYFFTAPSPDGHARLDHVEDEVYGVSSDGTTGTAQVRFTLQYSTLDDTCAVSTGVHTIPFVTSVVFTNGHFDFHYQAKTLLPGGSGTECVLTSVDTTYGGVTKSPAVTFTYDQNKAGRLAGSTNAYDFTGERNESYAYSASGQSAWTVTKAGLTSAYYLDAGWPNEELVTAIITPTRSWMASHAIVDGGDEDLLKNQATPGNGLGLTGGYFASVTHRLAPYYHPDQPGGYTGTRYDTCDGQNCGGIDNGGYGSADRWGVMALSPSGASVEAADTDRIGGRTVYGNVESTHSPMEGATPVELLSVSSGADQSNQQPLSVESFSYQYNDGPTSGSHLRGYEQQLTEKRRASLLTAGADAGTIYVYDTSSFNKNRLKATFQYGQTQASDGGVIPAIVGTFYFTYHTNVGNDYDPFGRILEVQGPCPVAATTDPACGTGALKTRYYFDGGTGLDANQLSKKSVEVTSPGGTTTLDTLYANYSPFGQPGRVTDPNGVVTTNLYDVDHSYRLYHSEVVDSQSGISAVTTYAYDAYGRPYYTQKPSGAYELTCYRTAANTDCSTGNPTPLLQWKATTYGTLGSTWSEKIVYQYDLNGHLNKESTYGPCVSGCAAVPSGGARVIKQYAADPLERPTYAGIGATSGELSGPVFGSTKVFDLQSNLRGIGLAYNDRSPNTTPDFCGGLDSATHIAASNLCTKLGYDRLNRVSTVDTYGPTPARACIGYDTSGNINSLKLGCDANQACVMCSKPAITYGYDDFGNLVSMSAPWMNNPSPPAPSTGGPILYSYDAQGHVLTKHTPDMAAGETLTSTYDSLGRLLTHKHLGPGINELLYSFIYDGAGDTYPTSNGNACQTLVASGAHAFGRVRAKIDSFGATWYTYNVLGEVTNEYRARATNALSTGSALSACNGTTRSDTNPNSHYDYEPDGRLKGQVYPHGRHVYYDYFAPGPDDSLADVGSGAYEKVKQIRVDTASSPTGVDTSPTANVTLVSNIRWEPYGGVRSYTLADAAGATVAYYSGQASNSLSSCGSTSSPEVAEGLDVTGRLRSIWVSTSTGTGNILRKNYRWSADQLVQEDTCYKNATGTPDVSVTYATSLGGTNGYDVTTQLTNGIRPANEFTSKGGPFGTRAYAYDGLGNRTSNVEDSWTRTFTYDSNGYTLQSHGVSSVQCATTDRCMATCGATSCGAVSGSQTTATYFADGRTNKLTTTPAMQNGSSYSISFTESDTYHLAADGVMSSANVFGSTYYYFYDSNGRRRYKNYAGGSYGDEFFWDGTHLLEDRGNGTTLGSYYTIDEYVWLGDRPVAMLKSGFSSAWIRYASDIAGDCRRYGASDPNGGTSTLCGHYFPVTDYLGKPVAMLDSQARITGVGEYDPYGHVNRVSYSGETAHIGGISKSKVLGYLNAPTGSPLSFRMRARFATADLCPTCSLSLSDSTSTTIAGTTVTGAALGRAYTPWTGNVSGIVHTEFKGDGSTTYMGAVFSGYDYVRFDQTGGAAAVWTPLRFPGQYLDNETDLFENWNRFYDASTGRYLAPEPLLSIPEYVLSRAAQGSATPVYGYAGNNPVADIDPDGLRHLVQWNTVRYTKTGEAIDVQGVWVDDPWDNPLNVYLGLTHALSFGLDAPIRRWSGMSLQTKKCSTAYIAGEVAAIPVDAAAGFATGARAAGAAGRGLEFSHWIPDRWGGPRSILNGNFVRTAVHALSDPWRYRFMPRAWKALNPKPSFVAQQLVRLPNTVIGATAGAAAGAAQANMADDSDDCE